MSVTPRQGMPVTSKGQVTVPKRIRDRLRLKPGDKVDFIERNGEVVLKRHFDAEAFKAALDKWTGYLPNPERKSVDEIIAEMRDG